MNHAHKLALGTVPDVFCIETVPGAGHRAEPGARVATPPPMTTVLGLDVGGTHSRARLVRDDELVGEASGPSASLAAAGRERAAVAMAAVLEELGLRPGAGLDAVCIGTAGTSARESEAFLVELLSPLTSTGPVVVVNDARLVLAAGGLTDGIACIAGTGSIAVGVVAGREERAGGWGYLLGDEGSGYWVTRMAVRELAERHDSHDGLGLLGDALLAATRLCRPQIALPALVRPSIPGRLGRLGPPGARLRGYLQP